jgi:hypothetical protein
MYVVHAIRKYRSTIHDCKKLAFLPLSVPDSRLHLDCNDAPIHVLLYEPIVPSPLCAMQALFTVTSKANKGAV